MCQKLNLASMLELATCRISKAALLSKRVEPALEKVDADMTFPALPLDLPGIEQPDPL